MVETIPISLKILSIMGEGGTFLLPCFFILFGGGLFWVIRKKKKLLFFLTPYLFLLLILLGAGFTFLSWQYRMGLLKEFGKVEYKDHTAYNVNKLPPAIYKEYAKNDFRPRFRDVKAKLITFVLLIPLVFFIQWLLFVLFFRKKNVEGNNDPPTPLWKQNLAEGGLLAGILLGLGSTFLLGGSSIYLLMAMLPLILPFLFGRWKKERLFAGIFLLLFLLGSLLSYYREEKRAVKIKGILLLHKERNGFTLARVFPPLPPKSTITEFGKSGISITLPVNSDPAHFPTRLREKGFGKIPAGTSVLLLEGKGENYQKYTIPVSSHYKDLGKGFGAVAEKCDKEKYNLFLIRGMGN